MDCHTLLWSRYYCDLHFSALHFLVTVSVLLRSLFIPSSYHQEENDCWISAPDLFINPAATWFVNRQVILLNTRPEQLIICRIQIIIVVIACRLMLNAYWGCLWGCYLVIIVAMWWQINSANCYTLALPLGRSMCLCCLYLSCLGTKDTTQSLWEMVGWFLIKGYCHKKCCRHVGCAVVQQSSS